MSSLEERFRSVAEQQRLRSQKEQLEVIKTIGLWDPLKHTMHVGCTGGEQRGLSPSNIYPENKIAYLGALESLFSSALDHGLRVNYVRDCFTDCFTDGQTYLEVRVTDDDRKFDISSSTDYTGLGHELYKMIKERHAARSCVQG